MDKIDRKIINALKGLKDDPDFTGGLDYEGIHNRALARNGFSSSSAESRYTFRDYLETYTWQFTHTMLRPMGAAVAVFVFAIIGWISVANASVHSLPGDNLYPVKISMEKAQLALALNPQQRANLQVEFTGRRLEEMVEIALLSHGESSAVQVAVDRFKSEVNTIKDEMKATQEIVAVNQKELARAVGRKTDVYSSTVAASVPELSVQVEEILEETKDQAVEVFITANEQEQDEETVRELERALQAEISKIETAYGDSADVAIQTAIALKAEGNYRRAFQVLKEFVLTQE
jgi:hypothetical protein